MTHYICTGGCGGVAEHPGTCHTEGCPMQGHSLEPCDCTDGKHYGRQHAHEVKLAEEKEGEKREA